MGIRVDLDRVELEKAEEFTKPGTANVSPEDRKKLRGLIDHYRGMAHPFTACVRDQKKHGIADDHAKARCAVLMDLGAKPPGWRSMHKAEDSVPPEIDEDLEKAINSAVLAANGEDPEPTGMFAEIVPERFRRTSPSE